MDREKFKEKFGIVGNSAELNEIIDVIKQVAVTDITVLITGESGTGKEVIAKAIHGYSKRADHSIIAVNCGAIPEGLIESELFGHEKGSFTSATEMRKGYFEIADGGTIFLDEIGEMPLATQVKLLRVLESGEYMRVGSSVSRHTNVRVIAATNKILEYEVQKKQFREDLYYRLRSVNIHLPPLRDRKEDIVALIHNFSTDIIRKNKIDFAGFSDDAIDLLVNYSWPGNIRELKNTIESIVVLERGKINSEIVSKYLQNSNYQFNRDRNLPVITNKTVEQAERELLYRALLDIKSDLMEIKDVLHIGNHKTINPINAIPVLNANIMTMEQMDRQMISDALKRNNGNRRNAARELKISERTLYRKIKDYNL